MSVALPISQAEADRLADELEDRRAEDVLQVAVDLFHPRLVLTCSWQKQSSVLVHMISEIQPDVRVVEFDTGLLFPETYRTREKLIERYPVRFERIEPELTVDQQADVHGPTLWEREPDRCCAMRKVAPLQQALEGMDAWITGIRREQSTTRENARKIEIDARRGIVRSSRSSTGPTVTSGGTSGSTPSPTTPCTTTGSRRSGACPAPIRSRMEPMSDRGAGRERGRSSAASTGRDRLEGTSDEHHRKDR